MRCPFCGHLDHRVIDSRASSGGDLIRRRRECESCSRRFTTHERVEDLLPTVVKKDGRREPFERQKLLGSLRIACNKRPVPTDSLDAVADAIEREAQESGRKELPSVELGEKVMVALRQLDLVAYVRFASVYRDFGDVDQFLAALGELVKPKSRE